MLQNSMASYQCGWLTSDYDQKLIHYIIYNWCKNYKRQEVFCFFTSHTSNQHTSQLKKPCSFHYKAFFKN